MFQTPTTCIAFSALDFDPGPDTDITHYPHFKSRRIFPRRELHTKPLRSSHQICHFRDRRSIHWLAQTGICNEDGICDNLRESWEYMFWDRLFVEIPASLDSAICCTPQLW